MRNFYFIGFLAILAYSVRAESNNEASKADAARGREKRGFDRLDSNGFSNFLSKRGMMDRLDSYNSFGSAGFGKRSFDRLDGSSFGSSGFGKRSFDRLDGSSFGSSSFGKRSFDRLDGLGSFGSSSFGKRGFDRLDSGNGFAGLAKRRFDSFDSSPFNGFRRKRTLDKLDGMNAFSSSGL